MSLLNHFKRLLVSFEKFLLVSLFSIMVLLSFVQVLLREFFSTGFFWGDIFLRHLVLWVAFLGAAIATQENRHFTIDVVKKLLPKKGKILSEIVAELFALVCLFFLSGSAFKFFESEWDSHTILFTVGNVQIPSFWMIAIIPLGFSLLWVHFLIKMLEDIHCLIGVFSSRETVQER